MTYALATSIRGIGRRYVNWLARRGPERSFELLSVTLYAAATLVEYHQAKQTRHQLKQ